jgi:hypothetical protein
MGWLRPLLGRGDRAGDRLQALPDTALRAYPSTTSPASCPMCGRHLAPIGAGAGQPPCRCGGRPITFGGAGSAVRVAWILTSTPTEDDDQWPLKCPEAS